MTAASHRADDRAEQRAPAVVLAPGVTFGEVADAFAGWEGGVTDLTGGLAGEPIAARWWRAGSEVSYTANPAIGLRVLMGTGLELLRSCPPTLTPPQAVQLARSRDTAEAMLGVTALGLLADATALPLLDRIAARAGRDEPLGGAAELATKRIGLAALATGAATITDRVRRHPGRDPVLGLVRPVAVRRQVLRLFLADPPEDRERMLAVVRAGLADPDWEVQWSALLGAHDLHLPELLPQLRRCRLPADGALRPVLEAVRDVAGHRLAASRSTAPGAESIQAVLDGTTADCDAAALLVASLRRPVPDQAEPLTGDPPGFTRVPRAPHWLGDETTGIRRVAPEASFAVATVPSAGIGSADVTRALATWSRDCGRPLRLATPDELEMATRGPDGRRFPWGNAREAGWRAARSPWGLALPLASAEWVETAGGRKALPGARHGCGSAPLTVAVAALRAVVATA